MATRRAGVIGYGTGGFFTAVGTSVGMVTEHAHPYAVDRPAIAIETVPGASAGVAPGAADLCSAGSARRGAGRRP